jgi:hypothetical protein
MVIVGNKADLAESREVSQNEGEELARSFAESTYFEASAKTRLNVDPSTNFFPFSFFAGKFLQFLSSLPYNCSTHASQGWRPQCWWRLLIGWQVQQWQVQMPHLVDYPLA